MDEVVVLYDVASTACLLKNELASYCYLFMLKGFSPGGAAKASLNRATIEIAIDPKPGELPMCRVKFVERQMEARTVEPFKTLG